MMSADQLTIKLNTVATVHYVGTFPDDGEQFDSSRDEGREPISFLVGHGQMIPGFEQEILGLGTGATKDFTLKAARAYGEAVPSNMVKMPRENFAGIDLEVGLQLVAEMDGHPAPFTVKEIEDDTVTVDFNHALAGRSLHFKVEVMGVRDPTDDEVSHGHAHGEHGHGH